MKYNEKQQIEIANYAIAHDNDFKATGEKYEISYQQVSAWVRKYGKSSKPQKKVAKKVTKSQKEESPKANALDILSRRDPVLEAQLEDVKRRLGLIK
ncbi:helix-turn-helix domain-containing protein [Companilactobacillus jidongensis]|uniref:helix-turn-helix domain-containing protein n=1 Tax=Companilactobacillus jidongensis TaxID=2486006 RepID=UPI000F7A29D7|nr:helix-turn-helix domain-containing protein [Companilactobacillus jidongensis]